MKATIIGGAGTWLCGFGIAAFRFRPHCMSWGRAIFVRRIRVPRTDTCPDWRDFGHRRGHGRCSPRLSHGPRVRDPSGAPRQEARGARRHRRHRRTHAGDADLQALAIGRRQRRPESFHVGVGVAACGRRGSVFRVSRVSDTQGHSPAVPRGAGDSSGRSADAHHQNHWRPVSEIRSPQRAREIPSRDIRLRSVLGFRPRICAAPPDPSMRPRLAWRILAIWRRSTSTSLAF